MILLYMRPEDVPIEKRIWSIHSPGSATGIAKMGSSPLPCQPEPIMHRYPSDRQPPDIQAFVTESPDTADSPPPEPHVQLRQTSELKPSKEGSDVSLPAPNPNDRSIFTRKKVIKVFDWIVRILGLTAAILFGVWAPISYQATLDGNSDNNVTQNRMLGKLEMLSSLDRLNKLDQLNQLDKLDQLDQLKELKNLDLLDHLQTLGKIDYRIDAFGVVWAMQFCESRAFVPACQQLSSSVDIASLLLTLTGKYQPPYRLPPPTSSSRSTSSSSPSPTQTSGPTHGDTHSRKNPVAIALGGILGGITVIVLVVALLYWRMKRVKSRGSDRESSAEAK